MGVTLDRFFENNGVPGVFLGFGAPGKTQGYFFSNPEKELICRRPEEIPFFFRNMEASLRAGRHVAGYWTYEFGCALLGLPGPPGPVGGPLAWLGVFNRPRVVDRKPPRPQRFPGPAYGLRPGDPALAYPDYRHAFENLQRRIANGETYQVNYTFPLNFHLDGSEGALFADLYARQPARYSAFLRGGGKTVLSFSPELFFQRESDRVLTRPMKGTWVRLPGETSNPDARKRLRGSEKNRAENLMIVDLMRNDLGRLCRTGSVRAFPLFQVESLPTLYQMTSTVSGRLNLPLKWEALFAALFPSGSVTGAPKIQTMKIIAQTETSPRGVYTGAIGCIAPSGDAVFNLPIRTLEVDRESRRARLGVGSGVVADSRARAEWRESLAKAAFITQSGCMRDYALLETLLWEPGSGFRHLGLHMARLTDSALFFRFPLNVAAVIRQLERHVAGSQDSRRVRLLVSSRGRVEIESKAWQAPSVGGVRSVAFSRRKVDSSNLYLRHKTTNREGYDRAWATARERGLADVLFCNERGVVTEGAVTNLFIRRGKTWLTSPVSEGLLPGVERAHWIQLHKDSVKERRLYRRDLISADEIFLCNSVRGMFPIKLNS